MSSPTTLTLLCHPPASDPQDYLNPQPSPSLPLTHHSLSLSIHSTILATLTVTQDYVNTRGCPLEVTVQVPDGEGL